MLDLMVLKHLLGGTEVENNKVINCITFEGLLCKINATKLIFPTIWSIHHWVATTTPTVATTDRCFSKLKLVMTHLHRMMDDNCLGHLVMTCYKNDITDELKFNKLLEIWLSSKPKHLNF